MVLNQSVGLDVSLKWMCFVRANARNKVRVNVSNKVRVNVSNNVRVNVSNNVIISESM